MAGSHHLRMPWVGHVIDARCSCGEHLGFHSGDGAPGVIITAFGRHLEAQGLPPLIRPGTVMELRRRYHYHGLDFPAGTAVRVLGRVGYYTGTLQTAYQALVVGWDDDGQRNPDKDVLIPDLWDRELRRPA